MQAARTRNNSTSENGWEEVSMPDDVRSIESFFSDDETVLLKGPSPSPRISESGRTAGGDGEHLVRIGKKFSAEVKKETVPQPLEIILAPTTPDHAAAKIETRRVSGEPVDTSLSPIEKTLVHQITRLSEELEVSRQKNQVLEQNLYRDDGGFFHEDDNTLLLRLGLKTIGFFLVLSVVQRKLLVSGLASIFGAAFVGGLLTYLGEQDELKRRRGEQ